MVIHKIKIIDQDKENREFIEKVIIFFKYFFLPIVIFTIVSLMVGLFFSSISLGIIAGIIATLLFIFRKRIPKRGKDKGKSKLHNLFDLKLFLIYWVTYTIGYFLSINIIQFINTKGNIYFIFLLTGLILELSAKVCQMIIYKKSHITMNKWFVLWVMFLAIFSFIVIRVLEYLNIAFSNPIYEIVAVSFGVTVLVHLAWRIMYKK